MQKTKQYSLKNFLRIANNYLNPEVSGLESIKNELMAWFALSYNTTLNDSRLLDMTLEELLVLFYLNKLQKNPNAIEELSEDDDSYEAWLQQQMGDSYVSEEQMVQQVVEYEKEELEKAKELPDSINTDFEQLQEELENGR